MEGNQTQGLHLSAQGPAGRPAIRLEAPANERFEMRISDPAETQEFRIQKEWGSDVIIDHRSAPDAWWEQPG